MGKNKAFRDDLKELCDNHEYSEEANITHRRTDVDMKTGNTRLTFVIELGFGDSETAMDYYWSLKNSALYKDSVTILKGYGKSKISRRGV